MRNTIKLQVAALDTNKPWDQMQFHEEIFTLAGIQSIRSMPVTGNRDYPSFFVAVIKVGESSHLVVRNHSAEQLIQQLDQLGS